LSVTCGWSVVFSTNKTDRHDIAEILFKVLLNIISPLSSYRLFVVTSLNMMGGKGSVLYIIGFDINGCLISRGKWKRHPTCPIGQVKMILWYVQFLKSKMINIELFSVGSHGEFYLNIASYVSCILRYFVDYGIPLSQIKIVLFILANRECLIRQRCCINIVFIFASQWKARVICGVLILENYPWCVLPLRSKYWKRDRLLK
jgi:hypothetical protein